MFFRLASMGKLKNSMVIISDINTRLINCYIHVRDSPNRLVKLCSELFANHNEEFFYYIRSIKSESDIDSASRFIYLNHSSFKGLYRVNKNGEFNTPIGKIWNVDVNKLIFDASKVLKSARIVCCDYMEAFKLVPDNEDVFVYLDPPYLRSDDSKFIGYNEKPFDSSEHIKLANIINSSNSKIILSNTKDSVGLYSNMKKVDEIYVDRFSFTSANEAMLRNYD